MDEKLRWLEESVLILGKTTVQGVEKAVGALLGNDLETAAAARELEKKTDAMFDVINEHCLEQLSVRACTRQEVNFIACSLKIAMELERIGDYANQIAKIVQRKLSQQDINSFRSLNASTKEMRDQSIAMLNSALKAYREKDPEVATVIKAQDETVDKRNKDLCRNMLCIVSVNSWVQEAVMDYHIAIRYIERVADRATNIAEQVYYIAHGESMKKRPVQEDLWDDR